MSFPKVQNMALLLRGCAYSCALLICLGLFLTWDNDPRLGNSNTAEEQVKSERKHRWEKGRKEKCTYGKLCFCYSYFPAVTNFYPKFLD